MNTKIKDITLGELFLAGVLLLMTSFIIELVLLVGMLFGFNYSQPFILLILNVSNAFHYPGITLIIISFVLYRIRK